MWSLTQGDRESSGAPTLQPAVSSTTGGYVFLLPLFPMRGSPYSNVSIVFLDRDGGIVIAGLGVGIV